MRKTLLVLALLVGLIVPSSASAATIPAAALSASNWATYMDLYDYHVATGNALTYYSGMICNQSWSQTPKQFPCYWQATLGGQTITWTGTVQYDANFQYHDVDGAFRHWDTPHSVAQSGVRGGCVTACQSTQIFDITEAVYQTVSGGGLQWLIMY